MKKREGKIIIRAAGLVIAAIVYAIFSFEHSARHVSAKDERVKSESYYVERVVDGDTLKLSNGEKVRLIGVDTPEVYFSEKLLRDSRKSGRDVEAIRAMGKKASEFTKRLCSGKKVFLEYDVEKRDRYSRILAYVHLEDGTFVNAKIIEEGYAQTLTVPPNVKYADLFLRLQRDARDKAKGLWGKGGL